MQKKLHEMNAEIKEIEAILAKGGVGRLATLGEDGYPPIYGSFSVKTNLDRKQSEAEKNKIRNYLLQRDLPGDRVAAALIR